MASERGIRDFSEMTTPQLQALCASFSEITRRIQTGEKMSNRKVKDICEKAKRSVPHGD